MGKYDEHGRVVDVEREDGPEWWAMGREYCKCEHEYDRHEDASTYLKIPGRCQANGCGCLGFETMAAGDEASNRQSEV